MRYRLLTLGLSLILAALWSGFYVWAKFGGSVWPCYPMNGTCIIAGVFGAGFVLNALPEGASVPHDLWGH